jgi:hypothetical protein
LRGTAATLPHCRPCRATLAMELEPQASVARPNGTGVQEADLLWRVAE